MFSISYLGTDELVSTSLAIWFGINDVGELNFSLPSKASFADSSHSSSHPPGGIVENRLNATQSEELIFETWTKLVDELHLSGGEQFETILLST